MRFDLASFRAAFFLIGLLLLLITLSALIPQTDIAEDQIINWREILGDSYIIIDKLALDRIYFAPYFFVLLGLLAINLIAGNIRRFKAVYRSERTLIKTRHLGSIIFHLSILLIIAGVILNYLFKFHGVYGLTEGQTVRDTPTDYFRVFAGPLWRTEYERFSVSFDHLEPEYKVSGTTTEAAVITLRPDTTSEPLTATVLINQPLSWGDLDFHFGAKTGYSPEVVLSDSTGKYLFKSFVRLATRRESGERHYTDFVLLPEYDLKIEIKITPPDSVTVEIPCRVTVERGGEIAYEGSLTVTDTVTLGEQRLTIPRLRRWCYLEVVESPFLNLVFFGFWSGLAGMTISLLSRLGRGKAQHR